MFKQLSANPGCYIFPAMVAHEKRIKLVHVTIIPSFCNVFIFIICFILLIVVASSNSDEMIHLNI